MSHKKRPKAQHQSPGGVRIPAPAPPSSADTQDVLVHREVPWRSVGLFILGALFGTGGLWQFLNARAAREQAIVARALASSGLRERLNEILVPLVTKSNRYAQIRDSANWQLDPKAHNELADLRQEIEMLKDDFRTVEGYLSSLESRPPRNIETDVIPPPPPENVRVEVLKTGHPDTMLVRVHWDPGIEGP